MQDTSESVKITYAKNLNQFNINTTINVPVDNKVGIKTIIDVKSYLYDEKIECINGKSLITGKIGVNVLYIDTDNITNTISDSQSFSESFLDSAINNDSHVNISNHYISNNITTTENSIHIDCEISISPILYMNIALPSNTSYENMYVKKSEIETSSITNYIDTNFDYTLNFETKDNISKLLNHDAYLSIEKTTAFDDCVLIEGKIYSKLLYEETKGEETVIKELCDTFNLKSELDISVGKDTRLDLSFTLDKSKETINTEIEDDNHIVTITQNIKVKGCCLKNISLELVDDIYSTDNELELTTIEREYNKIIRTETHSSNISNEIQLLDNETAIDEIISNLDMRPEITNTYIKDERLILEGLIVSHFVYIDENKEIKQRKIEIPFVVNTNTELKKLDCVHSNISILDCKAKSKRGTIIDICYEVMVTSYIYETDNKEIVDNITIGKALDYSEYDYQIFIAKPNETMWELCKRIKIAPEEIEKHNKNLPSIMLGGEKIIIKR